MATPKNYITSGINKNLLTPCRRVGLSRSKKTPKNINASPLTQIPNANVVKASPIKNDEVCSNVVPENLNFEETPQKLPTPKKAKKIVKHKVETKNISASSAKENAVRTELDKISLPSREKVTPKISKSETLDNPIQTALEKTVDRVDRHPSAKRNINFNKTNEPPNQVTTFKEEMSEINQNSPDLTHIEEKRTVADQEYKEEDDFETVIVKNKKRKLRLDSNDFLRSSDQAKHENSPQTNISLKEIVIKNIPTTLNQRSSGVKLGTFTTEDYLKEYYNNPEILAENMDQEESVVPELDYDKDLDAFSSISVKSSHQKSREQHSCRSTQLDNKKYVAVMCPLIDQSVTKKLKHSLSTKKTTLELTRLSEQDPTSSEPKLKKLTVSLDHLTKENISCRLTNEANEDIHLKEFPATSLMSKASHPKLNFYDDDEDEIFTSSPENDTKQRENLIKLILNMENEIRSKEGKLEKLKQAEVYKKKHSPEKLKISSDRWLEGCRAGLCDLLLKMQEHGPMEMETLINQLRIPDNIVRNLKL